MRAQARGPVIVVASAVIAACLGAVSFAHSSGTAVALIAVMTFCVALTLGLGTTIIQITVPDALRGRVMGVHSVMFTGLMPLVALVLGLIADVIDLRHTLRLMALVYAGLTLPWLLRAGIWRHRVPATRLVSVKES